MSCNCENNTIVKVYAKCDDRCVIQCDNMEKEGYVPRNINIGGGDDISFSFCSQCGKIQKFKPLSISDIEEALGPC